MTWRAKAALVGGLIVALSWQAGAQDDDAIDIRADESIEWLQDAKKYVATGNAVVRDGDTTLRADRIIAFYRDRRSGQGTEIWRVEMHGNVSIDFDEGTIWGDDGAYESDSRVFVMTGESLRYRDDDMTVTADDSLEYWRNERMAVARGKAFMKDDDRNVRADTLAAYFHDDESGSGTDRFDAFGNVWIETKDEYIRAAKAVYDPDSDVAKLSGSVKITRGDDQFNGETAVLDFKTNVSRIVSAGGGPVRALVIGDD